MYDAYPRRKRHLERMYIILELIDGESETVKIFRGSGSVPFLRMPDRDRMRGVRL